MTRFINGDPQAGLFLSGFFVVMMFGIPAICLAIYRAAFKENKDMVKGIMGSGAATSFIANITEPVEFSFMFISPMLYVPCFLRGIGGHRMLPVEYPNWVYFWSVYCGLFD